VRRTGCLRAEVGAEGGAFRTRVRVNKENLGDCGK